MLWRTSFIDTIFLDRSWTHSRFGQRRESTQKAGSKKKRNNLWNKVIYKNKSMWCEPSVSSVMWLQRRVCEDSFNIYVNSEVQWDLIYNVAKFKTKKKFLDSKKHKQKKNKTRWRKYSQCRQCGCTGAHGGALAEQRHGKQFRLTAQSCMCSKRNSGSMPFAIYGLKTLASQISVMEKSIIKSYRLYRIFI